MKEEYIFKEDYSTGYISSPMKRETFLNLAGNVISGFTQRKIGEILDCLPKKCVKEILNNNGNLDFNILFGIITVVTKSYVYKISLDKKITKKYIKSCKVKKL